MNCWPLIFVALGAALWAVPSVLLFRFGSSLFRKLKREYWNPVYSSKAAKQTFGYKHDGFHHFQSASVACMLLFGVFAHHWQIPFTWWIAAGIKFTTAGITWIIFFPVTYGLLSPYHKQIK
jgi:hypothetical protein